MNGYTKHSNGGRGQRLTALFIMAALIVLFVVLFAGKHGGAPQYVLKIKELGSDSMLAYSTFEELGYGEILLTYGKDMVIEDVNGQVIDRGELHTEDRIRVSITSQDVNPESDPVLEKIVLLPDGSDEYV